MIIKGVAGYFKGKQGSGGVTLKNFFSIFSPDLLTNEPTF